MKKIKKLIALFTIIGFSSFTVVNNVHAQTDSLKKGSNDTYRDANRIQQTDDVQNNMNQPENKKGTIQENNKHSQSLQDSSTFRRSYPDSMGRQSRSMSDSSGIRYRQQKIVQDTIKTAKTVQPEKAVPAKKAVPAEKAMPAAGKNNVKTEKNKTMYLVPDSTLKKDTLK